MDEATARVIQVVAGIFAVAIIAVTALATQPTTENQALAVVGAAFTLIGALLGVHFGIKALNGKTG